VQWHWRHIHRFSCANLITINTPSVFRVFETEGCLTQEMIWLIFVVDIMRRLCGIASAVVCVMRSAHLFSYAD